MSGADVLAAVVRYEVAASAVTALSRRIGESISACPISKRVESGEDGFDRLLDGSRTMTHLYHQFKESYPCDSGYGNRALQPDEIIENLGDERDGCPHCLAAFHLIQERRAARKQFGIAKRAIRTIGKSELKRKAIAPAAGMGWSMIDEYEIRQQVRTIHKAWLEVIASGSIERVVRDEYNRYVKEYPEEYFEFCRVERHEYCLAFTPKEPK